MKEVEKILARSKVGNYDYNIIIRYTEGKDKPFAVEREYPDVERLRDVIDNFSTLPSALKCFERITGRKFTAAFKASFYLAFCKLQGLIEKSKT